MIFIVGLQENTLINFLFFMFKSFIETNVGSTFG